MTKVFQKHKITGILQKLHIGGMEKNIKQSKNREKKNRRKMSKEDWQAVTGGMLL